MPKHPIKNSITHDTVEVLKKTASNVDSTITTSLFQHNLLEVKSPKPQLHKTNFDYRVASILFFAFILFVWLYAVNRKRLNQVVKAFYISRFANQLAREEISIGNRVTIFLSTLFVLTLSLFIMQTLL